MVTLPVFSMIPGLRTANWLAVGLDVGWLGFVFTVVS